jgi:hypothetical protein
VNIWGSRASGCEILIKDIFTVTLYIFVHHNQSVQYSTVRVIADFSVSNHPAISVINTFHSKFILHYLTICKGACRHGKTHCKLFIWDLRSKIINPIKYFLRMNIGKILPPCCWPKIRIRYNSLVWIFKGSITVRKLVPTRCSNPKVSIAYSK